MRTRLACAALTLTDTTLTIDWGAAGGGCGYHGHSLVGRTQKPLDGGIAEGFHVDGTCAWSSERGESSPMRDWIDLDARLNQATCGSRSCPDPLTLWHLQEVDAACDRRYVAL